MKKTTSEPFPARERAYLDNTRTGNSLNFLLNKEDATEGESIVVMLAEISYSLERIQGSLERMEKRK